MPWPALLGHDHQMRWLEGRVAVITGAARGLGREHALLFASQGARLVLNDMGAEPDGTNPSPEPVRTLAAEICAGGGEAVATSEDVSQWEGGARVIQAALDSFGELHVLVNNAGILRDRLIVNMTEQEWDSVVSVHLKGHFVPLRHAAAYWRQAYKAGRRLRPAVINTSSTSGLYGNPGQSNYGAAKAGVAALTTIAAGELARYGVRVNAVVPTARTRLTESTPGLAEMVSPPAEPDRFDEWDPANVSPLVAWLASESCPVTGQLIYAFGGTVAPMRGWSRGVGLQKTGRWTIEELAKRLPDLLGI